MDNKQENMKKLVEQVQELSEKSKEISETLDYVKMPIGVYLIEKEMAKEREMHLLKTLKVLIVSFMAVLTIIAGIFVWYLIEFSGASIEYLQDVDSVEGASTIYDGIHAGGIASPENK